MISVRNTPVCMPTQTIRYTHNNEYAHNESMRHVADDHDTL